MCEQVYKHLNAISVSERNGMDNIHIHRGAVDGGTRTI